MGGIKIFEGMSQIEKLRFSQMAAFRLKDIDHDAYMECVAYR